MNTIHPTAVIGASVRMGRGNVVGPFAVIGGRTRIGDGNWIGAHAVLGAPPEARAFPHPEDWIDGADGPGLLIGDRNVIREGVNVHGGWHSSTNLGDNIFLMNQSYVAHDGILGNDVTLASHVSLAGHTTIGRGANLGLGAVVHQHTTVGAYTMIGMSSVVTRHLPPFAVCFGSPARVRHVNTVGMQRGGFDTSAIEWAAEWLEGGALIDPATTERAPASMSTLVTAYATGAVNLN